MRTFMIAMLLLITLAGAATSSATNAQVNNRWLTYRGAWFEIKYPASFAVNPSQRSSTSTRGFDSVFFAAPDGSVEFYVFSPQWNGTLEIEMNSGTEVLVSQSAETRGSKTVRWVTIRARDNSYSRSFEDTYDSASNTRKVFGIRYRNQVAYSRYRHTYLAFKQSLRQFGD